MTPGLPESICNPLTIVFEICAVAAATKGIARALDPDYLVDVAQLWAECVAAKEALLADTDAGIAVMLAGTHTTSGSCGAFEDMIRPAVTRDGGRPKRGRFQQG